MQSFPRMLLRGDCGGMLYLKLFQTDTFHTLFSGKHSGRFQRQLSTSFNLCTNQPWYAINIRYQSLVLHFISATNQLTVWHLLCLHQSEVTWCKLRMATSKSPCVWACYSHWMQVRLRETSIKSGDLLIT